jgi:DnaJ-class molecular chaperone
MASIKNLKIKKKCDVCLGTGSILVQIGETENDFVENECDACSGTGEID